MFGATVDYYILKPLTHKRNLLAEEQLNAKAKESTFTFNQATAYFEKTQSYFRGRIPVNPNLEYVDVGCGMGRLAIGLCLAGARHVTGIDVVERRIVEANALAEKLDADRRPSFHTCDIHDWEADREFDVAFVLGAMEHIHHPGEFLKGLASLLKPKGLAYVSHEPFQSPVGDHMRAFFRVQVPWRGMLFSEKAILRLRRECYRPSDMAERYQDIVGGLNLMSYSRYLQIAHDAGFEFVSHSHDPQLRLRPSLWPLVPISAALTRIPRVRDFFIVNAYSVLKKGTN